MQNLQIETRYMGNYTVSERIACTVDRYGGRTFYVGGFVRDKLLGTENKDVDIEVHGIEPELLHEILGEVGDPLTYGSSFGIYSIRGENIDIAIPRRERATGKGHRDFEVEVDPFAGTYEAARRRDFTINALMEDVMTGEVEDHFGGLKDLKNGIIRHIDDDSFIEDPLRVLRAAQFAARLNFSVAEETIDLCRSIDVSTLSRERVEEELRKALLKADKPSLFFEELREMDQLSVWFPELEDLIGVEQDPIFHPEGDVWKHTMEVLDRAAQYRAKASNPFAFMLLALTHDFGKSVTTKTIKGRIHAYEHEIEGVPIAGIFLKRITGEKAVTSYVLNMIPLHMKPNIASHSKPKYRSTNKMFDEAAAPEDLIYFALSDKPVAAGNEEFAGDPGFLWERLSVYKETMAKPYVMGRDLIEAGQVPGDCFTELLEYSHKLRLAGVDKENALRQTLAYARRMKK